jgi:hypothetical protein
MIPLPAQLRCAAVAAALMAGFAPNASAALIYDLRVLGGGKDAEVGRAGDVVRMELVAMVTGADPLLLEGFSSGYLSILSSVGGGLLGDLKATLEPAFNMGATTPGNSSLSLDSDTDLDIGSNNSDSSTGYLFVRSGLMPNVIGTPIPNGQEFRLAVITFTATSVAPFDTPYSIQIFPRVPEFTFSTAEAIWQEDGASMNTSATGTAPLPTVAVPVTIHVPEPGTGLLLSCGVLALAARRRRVHPAS